MSILRNLLLTSFVMALQVQAKSSSSDLGVSANYAGISIDTTAVPVGTNITLSWTGHTESIDPTPIVIYLLGGTFVDFTQEQGVIVAGLADNLSINDTFSWTATLSPFPYAPADYQPKNTSDIQPAVQLKPNTPYAFAFTDLQTDKMTTLPSFNITDASNKTTPNPTSTGTASATAGTSTPSKTSAAIANLPFQMGRQAIVALGVAIGYMLFL